MVNLGGVSGSNLSIDQVVLLGVSERWTEGVVGGPGDYGEGFLECGLCASDEKFCLPLSWRKL